MLLYSSSFISFANGLGVKYWFTLDVARHFIGTGARDFSNIYAIDIDYSFSTDHYLNSGYAFCEQLYNSVPAVR